MVPSLRDWLTQKQQETFRGRAELKLVDRSELWQRKPENRFLPSLFEWIRLRALTDSTKWKEAECQMMTRAARHHGIRTACFLAAV
jgi:hypothetical protein